MSSDKSLEELRANMKATLDADPELKAAFLAAVKEARKPENIEAMTKPVAKLFVAIKAIQDEAKKRKEN